MTWGPIPSRGIKMDKSLTGPRTPGGKARSSRNAAKHWVLSKRILPEELEQAAILRNGIEEDLKPEGLIEQEIIDDLVLNRLHKRRIDILFAKEFSKANIKKSLALNENNERPLVRYLLRRANLLRGQSAEPARRLRPVDCIHELEGLMKQIGHRGPQSDDLELLQAIYGGQPTPLAAQAMRMLADFPKEQTEKDRAAILNLLRAEIESQKFRQKLATDLLAIECPTDSYELPGPAFETLLRYGAANAREFASLSDSFERIRRLRRSAA
jgi:hypothetical protein